MSQFEKKAFETTAFEKKKFDGAATQFETRKWDGVKSFTDGKLETPDFIARGQGREYPVLARCLQTIRHAQSDLQGRSWKEADKHLGRTVTGTLKPSGRALNNPP